MRAVTGRPMIPATRPAGLLAAGLGRLAVPAPVAAEGERAALRYLEFFAAQIRNPNTRRAYARAASDTGSG
ncbi:MAG: hypothetical protein ICV73_24350 [Acetobacteraceae bacterium]|nr:hypothetical protein [Acetobacteraceae bacterium]